MTNPTLRLRVFAGPNGSGKSTIINAVRAAKVKDIPVDFGVCINADDITKSLRKGSFSFTKYKVKVSNEEFVKVVLDSGLINEEFPKTLFTKSYLLKENKIQLVNPKADEHLAQIIADFLRKKLLSEKKKFSFETVFSHPSKLDIMKQAAAAGYKVYLYFVSTEDPEINKFRVKKVRVIEGGHDVPEDKIISRYYRSLDLLFEASQIAYQAYFFDNSKDGEGFELFAHFKNVKGEKKWDEIDKSKVPAWFIKYYSSKVRRA